MFKIYSQILFFLCHYIFWIEKNTFPSLTFMSDFFLSHPVLFDNEILFITSYVCVLPKPPDSALSCIDIVNLDLMATHKQLFSLWECVISMSTSKESMASIGVGGGVRSKRLTTMPAALYLYTAYWVRTSIGWQWLWTALFNSASVEMVTQPVWQLHLVVHIN